MGIRTPEDHPGASGASGPACIMAHPPRQSRAITARHLAGRLMGVIDGLAKCGAGRDFGGPEAGRGAGSGFLAMRGSFMIATD